MAGGGYQNLIMVQFLFCFRSKLGNRTRHVRVHLDAVTNCRPAPVVADPAALEGQRGAERLWGLLMMLLSTKRRVSETNRWAGIEPTTIYLVSQKDEKFNVKKLQTKRLLIRQFALDDLEIAHQVLDQEMQWDGTEVSLQQRRKILQRYIMLAEWNDGSRLFGSQGIFFRETKQLMGLCGFHPWLWTPSQKSLFWPELLSSKTPDEYTYASFELSILYGLSHKHRGHGFATEAAKALIEYAFYTLNVQRVFADTTRSNSGSIKCNEAPWYANSSPPNSA